MRYWFLLFNARRGWLLVVCSCWLLRVVCVLGGCRRLLLLVVGCMWLLVVCGCWLYVAVGCMWLCLVVVRCLRLFVVSVVSRVLCVC